MHSTTILFVLAAILATVTSAPPAKYSDKYDSIDVDAVLANDRVLTNYVKCMLDQGPCTAEGREFRKRLPEALSTACEKCTDGQKNMVKKVSKHLIEHRKSDWELLRKKYDPKGVNQEKFRKFLASP